jgi:hypothetical protein
VTLIVTRVLIVLPAIVISCYATNLA